jgi:3'-phosphoadenosine 5'-phosphosulfate sulfotransferase (PAPS reductase)/FAD synthetase
MELGERIKHARGLIALYTTPNATLRVLFSGGKDSMVVAHLAATMPGFNGVGHVRTLTGPASIAHSTDVLALAERNGWDCVVAQPFTTLPMLAAKNGLPGPALHSFFYSYLKERPIRQLTKMARKTDSRRRVIWLTGIRRAESAQRAQVAQERQIVSANEWWINPILEWSDNDVREYIKRHDLKVPNWHHSIDCFCGAYADPSERALIMKTHADQARYVELVEQIARAGREIQLLEVQYGVRKPENVVPESMCAWGHGLNAKTAKLKNAATTICNKCGVTDEVLRQATAAKASA